MTMTNNAINNTTISGTLSSANLLSLSTVPVLLIPAPGANKIIVIDFLSMNYIINTTAYTLPLPPNDIVIEYDNISAGAGLAAVSSIGPTGIFDQNSNNKIVTKTTSFIIGSTSSLYINKGIYVSQKTDNMTLGDGTANYFIRYSLIDAS